MKEWKGAKAGNFDYLQYFIKKGHELGLEIHASLNVFCAGHNYFDRGMVYSGHPDCCLLYTSFTYIYTECDDKDRNFPTKMYRFPMPQAELDNNGAVTQYAEWQ